MCDGDVDEAGCVCSSFLGLTVCVNVDELNVFVLLLLLPAFLQRSLFLCSRVQKQRLNMISDTVYCVTCVTVCLN